MEVNILNFSSFFEIFAALNLAYAGSETFRSGLNKDILELHKAISLRIRREIPKFEAIIQEIKYKIIVTLNDNYNTDRQAEVSVTESFFSNEVSGFKLFIRRAKLHERKIRKFENGFKSLFLLSGFCSLFIILMAGYSQFYEIEYNHMICTCIFLFTIVIIGHLFIFIRSFYITHCARPMKPSFIVLWLVICIIFSIYFAKENISKHDCIQERLIITLMILVVTSPYLIHFFRALLHKFIYRTAYFFWFLRLGIAFSITRIRLQRIEDWSLGPNIFSNDFINTPRIKVSSLIFIHGILTFMQKLFEFTSIGVNTSAPMNQGHI